MAMTRTYQRTKGYPKLNNIGNDDRSGNPNLGSQLTGFGQDKTITSNTGHPDIYQPNNPSLTLEPETPTQRHQPNQLEDASPDLKHQQSPESGQKKVTLSVNKVYLYLNILSFATVWRIFYANK